MTSPNGEFPAGAYGINTVASMQNVTQKSVADGQAASVLNLLGEVWDSLIDNLLGGFSNVVGAIAAAINQFLSNLVQAFTGNSSGGLVGGLLSLFGWRTSTENKVTDITDVKIPALQNQIDDISSGGVSAVRASFFQDGVWTKPAGYSRHVVVVIGGASGGGRSNDTNFGNRGLGGYSGGRNDYEFFDSDLPATVACQIGLGGLGATADQSLGAPGGQTNFGAYGSAGGALGNGFGFGGKTRQLRGGNGGAFFANAEFAASSGTGHDYANGGAGGTPNGSGNPGGDGNRPVPNTLAEYGTGGGGGARKSGTGSGGRGGNGAVPGGPGGGGGAYAAFGFAGNGGNGADGAIFITSYK